MLVQIAQFVSGSLMSQVGIISVVLEALLRLVPSQKPLSIAYMIAQGCHQVGAIIDSIAQFLDKVLPQNVSK